jgi:hypothetical protein
VPGVTTRSSAGLALALLALIPAARAQEEQEPEQPEAASAPDDDPDHALELALSEESFWLAYRNGLHRGDGFVALGFLANEDDDLALSARFLRFGEPTEIPLGVGVGLGAFGAALEDSEDEVFAVTLTGSLDYAFPTEYPTRVVGEISYAPDIATFAQGEEVLDLQLRVEVDLSSFATAFAGYRDLEVELEGPGEHDLVDAFELGVRLGF